MQKQWRIAAIKSSEVIGVKYMQEWEEKVIEKRKAREEGLEEGRAEGRKEGRSEGAEYKIFSLIRKKMAKGCEPEEIADILEEDLGYVQEVYKFLESQMDRSEEASWDSWRENKTGEK